jgi:hypothetical protein
LPFALLSILLYFLLCSSLLVLDSSDFSIPRFRLHFLNKFDPLTPNDPFRGRTSTLTSKRCNLYIYSTNIGTEYFKQGIYSPFFFLFKMQFVS